MGAKTIDEYLAGVASEQRAALETLRGQIVAAAPGAEACISYGQPAFRKGRVVCGFGATKKHCALYLFRTPPSMPLSMNSTGSASARVPSASSRKAPSQRLWWRSSSRPASPRTSRSRTPRGKSADDATPPGERHARHWPEEVRQRITTVVDDYFAQGCGRCERFEGLAPRRRS